MGVATVTNAVQKFSKETFSKPCRIISVKKNDNEWLSEMEMIVEDEEMRRYARSPVIGLWEVHLDNRYNVISFEQKGTREATALHYEMDEFA